jgi:hypothetical protein
MNTMILNYSKMILTTLNALNVERNAGAERILRAMSIGGVTNVNRHIMMIEMRFIQTGKKMKIK